MYDFKTFLKRVDTSGDCWMWLGARSDRYGTVQVAGSALKAHRAAWLLVHGEIPDGLCVCHKCDNPQCVNPDHLFLGTAKDNARDRHKKGRSKNIFQRGHKINCGSNCGKSKLTELQVEEIRTLLASGLKQREIALQFGVHTSHVSRIKNRRTWSHV